jgi:hypothetical protein
MRSQRFVFKISQIKTVKAEVAVYTPFIAIELWVTLSRIQNEGPRALRPLTVAAVSLRVHELFQTHAPSLPSGSHPVHYSLITLVFNVMSREVFKLNR